MNLFMYARILYFLAYQQKEIKDILQVCWMLETGLEVNLERRVYRSSWPLDG